ncbi:MAG: bifunctional phosphoribosylaminoimidazolecarboxamide formyltransferase/IMP cyclohydrolase [Methanobacteriota archaeon]
MPVQRALLSVHDKTGIVDLAKGLVGRGVEILSTGGTRDLLSASGVRSTAVADVTGFPEILGGRVKTLHPAIEAGILARRIPSDMAELARHDIRPIDLVAVNLYPFEETVAKGRGHEDVLEMIDVGGPTMVRAAAKNYPYVAVVTSPSQYAGVLDEIARTGDVSIATKERLAAQAFAVTARYDAIVDQYFRHRLVRDDFPDFLSLSFGKIQDLRYGENSHQRAAFYRGKPTKEPCVVNSRQIHGKELSYNNIVDADTAIEAAKDFARPSVAIVKHATPTGIASADTVHEAYRLAFDTDTYSPFGGVVGLNRPVDLATAKEMADLFLEVVAAPGYETDALDLLSQKKNVRLLEVPGLERRGAWGGLQVRSVVGGLVIQDRDIKEPDVRLWKPVTKREPTPQQTKSMLFAFKAVRHVKSNAVVFVRDEHTVAIGGGQTSRVDATWIATKKGGDRIRGSVLASEAFFPFRDGVDLAAEHGVAAIVQPGGSIRDAEVIQAADEHGIAMVFTGQRSFRH